MIAARFVEFTSWCGVAELDRRPAVARMQVAILDDNLNVALEMADWSPVAERADITVFNDHVSDPDELIWRLAPFDVVFGERERTPLPRSVID